MRDKEKTVDPLPDSFESEEAAGEFWDSHRTMDYQEYLEPVDDAIEFGQNAVESPLRRAASFVLRVLTAMKIDHAAQNPCEIDFWRKAYLLVRL